MKRSLFSLYILLLSTGIPLKENWPQAGGPNGDFVIKNATVPSSCSVTLDQNIAWKRMLP